MLSNVCSTKPNKPLSTADTKEARRALTRARCEGSLLEFIRYFWHVVEPARDLVEGPALEAICLHLEAVSRGQIKRLLINVPPGSCKTLSTNVFWPAWEWTWSGATRYVTFSYSANLTETANRAFLAIVRSQEYRELWGDRFDITQTGVTEVANSATGYKFASSVGGVGTGRRGDRVLIDDPHSVQDGESAAVRGSTVEWFQNTISNRLNDAETSAIVVIMQRVHEDDVSGYIISNAKKLGYEHLCIPAEYVPGLPGTSVWQDWRTEEGELYWPDRYPLSYLRSLPLTPWAYAGQYQQDPEPKGGGILQRAWWKPWTEKVFPTFDFVIASLDPAYGEKQENDFSAMTVWGVWTENDIPRVMLRSAWQGQVPIHDLVEATAKTLRKFKVTRLLIEAKASGISVSQEMRRLYIGEDWSIQMIDPGRQDKVTRVHSIAHLFYEGIVWVPASKDDATGDIQLLDWAGPVVHQCALFPRGAHDDYVDSTSQALRYLRECGVLTKRAERDFEIAEAMRQPPGPLPKLYPV